MSFSFLSQENVVKFEFIQGHYTLLYYGAHVNIVHYVKISSLWQLLHSYPTEEGGMAREQINTHYTDEDEAGII